MTPAKCSQYSPLSCTLDKHYAETAKKRDALPEPAHILNEFCQSNTQHTHARLSADLVQFQMKILILSL